MNKGFKSGISDFLTSKKRFIPYLIFIFSCALYINTIGHQFTQDDAIAIYQNEFTQKGISGLADIFGKDTFHGFFGSDKSQLVSGGRYRPLTLGYFALLWEVFGDHPLPFHVSNVLMYAGLCVLIYFFLLRLNYYKSKKPNLLWATVASMIYAAHPIHTEAVANVKGLDEIWSFGFGLLSTFLVLKYVDFKKVSYLILSGIMLLLGILSKENAVGFIGLIPITVLFFRDTPWKTRIPILAMLGAVSVIYAALRISVIGLNFGEPPLEMMNNPFLKVEEGVYYAFSSSEKWASIIYGLLQY